MVDTLSVIEGQLKSQRDLAMLRRSMLDKVEGGLPAIITDELANAFSAWTTAMKSNSPNLPEEETNHLGRILTVHRICSEADPDLHEELGRQGSHALLAKLIKFDISSYDDEEVQDAIIELQDIAAEATAFGSSLLQRSPFTQSELRARLPLFFFEGNQLDGPPVLINQVKRRQSEQKDVGFVMWPSAVALSSYLSSRVDLWKGKTILELGSGCGLTGVFVALRGQSFDSTHVILSDFNPTVLQNLQQNILLNDVETCCSVTGLDFYDQSGKSENGWLDMNGVCRDQVDLIIGADIICQDSDAVAAAKTIKDALKPRGTAHIICADSNHRFGVEIFEKCCRDEGLVVSVGDVKDFVDASQISEEFSQTSAFVEDMKLQLYIIEK